MAATLRDCSEYNFPDIVIKLVIVKMLRIILGVKI